MANYALASTGADKAEQEARHALSAAGPDPELAAVSGLRAGVLAVERGDAEAAEELFTRASSLAVVQTPQGVKDIESGFWAATQLGALFIGQNRLRDAESAYGVAAVSSNSRILDAVSLGMRRITQLRTTQRQAPPPQTVG